MSSSFPAGVFPLPAEGIDDESFWAACENRELVVQQCADCGAFRHPPKPTCAECQSFEDDWAEVPGTGEVYSYTVTHYTVGPDHEEHVPYNVAVVLLDGTEDVRFVTHLVDAEDEDIEIGMPVEVTWEEVEDVTLPLFEPA